MFTGLVETLGTVTGLQDEGPARRIEVTVSKEWAPETQIGESIALNGCCLTVVTSDADRLEFQAGPETLTRTNLGTLVAGDPINLERALPADGRLGGHFVQGHIDGVGHVEQVDQDGEWVTMWFSIPADLSCYVVSKGSVAVDGVSLTVVDVTEDRFSVALIPHTLEITTLGARHPGDAVNLETDLLAKYVEKLMIGETLESAPPRGGER